MHGIQEFIACIQMRYISAHVSKHHIMESLCINNLFLSLQCLRFKMIHFILLFVTMEFSYNIWWGWCFEVWSFQLANTHHRIFLFTLSKCLSNVLWLCQGVLMCSSKPLFYNFILVCTSLAFMLFFQWKLICINMY